MLLPFLLPMQTGAIRRSRPLHQEGLENGANGRTRTADRLFTKQLLYQLSYIGFCFVCDCSRKQSQCQAGV